MQTLKAENLTRTYGEKTIFDHLTFNIKEHDRIGLIGVNGSGKTSLLNTLDGIGESTGQIETPKKYSIGYLKQHPEFNDELTVLDAVFSGGQSVFRIIRHYEEVLNRYSNHPEDEKIQNQYMKAEAQMNEADAWTAESDVKTILTQLKINNMDQKVGTLSGGQKRRVALAQVLIQSPDLLLLDEPTNHLDFESIDWLEQYLSQYKGALVLVTHDRYFLDRVVNNIWELSFGKLYSYQGNYQDYVRQKAERVERATQEEHKQQQLYKHELAWMRKGAKARSTKQQGRINRFNDLKDSINHLQVEDDVDISLGQQRLGKKVIQLKDANLKIDDKQILDDFSMLIQRGERVGISGENGAGKTTFLNVLAEKVPLDSGTITIGETVKMAYYTQQMEPIPGDKRIINYLSDVGHHVTDNDGNDVSVTDLLEKFLFPRFMHGTLIRKLSGGEKRRLYLLKLLMQAPNVLLLDEPTNDLDISTLTVLEDYIQHFNGTMITVSHDRYFLDKVADHLLIFHGAGNIESRVGKFTDYLKQSQNEHHANQNSENNAKQQAKSSKPEPSKKQKTKLTYAESIEWDQLEDQIDQLDHQRESIENEMAEHSTDYDKIRELQSQLETVQTQSDQKMKRWEYLSQFVDE